MKSRELELASFYLIFDLIILNIAIIILGLWDVSFSLHHYEGMSLYLLQGNLAALITYLSYTKQNPYLEDSFKKRAFINFKRILVFMFVSGCISVLLIPSNYSELFFLKYCALVP